jgi:hypothetical protein
MRRKEIQGHLFHQATCHLSSITIWIRCFHDLQTGVVMTIKRREIYEKLFFFSCISSSLNIPISSSTGNNFIQCVSVDGQIGLVYNNHVEPIHIIPTSKSISTTTTTMNQLFQRKTG